MVGMVALPPTSSIYPPRPETDEKNMLDRLRNVFFARETEAGRIRWK